MQQAMTRKLVFLLPLLALSACAAPRDLSAPPPAAPPGAPPVPIAPPPPRGEPAQFSNLPAAQLRAMLGEPVFTRQDGAAQMWRYDAAGCRAFFFLYGNGADQRVRHVQTVPAGAGQAADPACLSALRKG
jgi:hypothetical protein